jgi:uncharacterized protein YjbJ (UPF0337 family)
MSNMRVRIHCDGMANHIDEFNGKVKQQYGNLHGDADLEQKA